MQQFWVGARRSLGKHGDHVEIVEGPVSVERVLPFDRPTIVTRIDQNQRPGGGGGGVKSGTERYFVAAAAKWCFCGQDAHQPM